METIQKMDTQKYSLTCKLSPMSYNILNILDRIAAFEGSKLDLDFYSACRIMFMEFCQSLTCNLRASLVCDLEISDLMQKESEL